MVLARAMAGVPSTITVMAANADAHFMAILPRSCRLMTGERNQPGLEPRRKRV
jgi:hypothetical protein